MLNNGWGANREVVSVDLHDCVCKQLRLFEVHFILCQFDICCTSKFNEHLLILWVVNFRVQKHVQISESTEEGIFKRKRAVLTQYCCLICWDQVWLRVELFAWLLIGDWQLSGICHKRQFELHLSHGKFEWLCAELANNADFGIAAVLNPLKSEVPRRINPEPNHVKLFLVCKTHAISKILPSRL